MNIELQYLVEWFQINLLSLNVTKTNYIIFTKRRNITANITIGNTTLAKLDNTKFLGVIIAFDLSWNKHIEIVLSKISKSVGIIAKVRHLLPITHTCILYRTLVEPFISYCNLVWAGRHTRENLDKILRLQKRYCRLITFSDLRAHSKPLFNQLSILTVCTNFSLAFTWGSHLHLVGCRTKCRWSTVQIEGPKFWNGLPCYLKCFPTLNQFKSNFKAFVFSTS